jgi:hypothetical protein
MQIYSGVTSLNAAVYVANHSAMTWPLLPYEYVRSTAVHDVFSMIDCNRQSIFLQVTCLGKLQAFIAAAHCTGRPYPNHDNLDEVHRKRRMLL